MLVEAGRSPFEFLGGDMEALILQGKARGFFENRTITLTAGETAMYRLATQIPNGVIIGARGPHGVFAPDNELNNWFRKAYSERFGAAPTSFVQDGAGHPRAEGRDREGGGGKTDKPSDEAVIAAFEGLTYEGPRPGRHEARQGSSGNPIHRIRHLQIRSDNGPADHCGHRVVPAECVNPLRRVKSEEWIKGGFKGARCN